MQIVHKKTLACQICSKSKQQNTEKNDAIKMSQKFHEICKLLQNALYFIKKNSWCIFPCMKR